MVNKENTNVTGLESSTNFEQDEKSIVKALLEAADYKTGNEDNTKKIFVKKQSGEPLFSFRIRGLSQSEIQAAAKKATKHWLWKASTLSLTNRTSLLMALVLIQNRKLLKNSKKPL